MTPSVSTGASSSSMPHRLNLLLILLVTLFLTCCHAKTDTERKISVINKAGFRVNLYWINRWKNDERVLNTEEAVLAGTDSSINSYVGHEFEAVELPGKKSGQCKDPDHCLSAIFQVNQNYGQVFTLLEGLEIQQEDDKTRARDEAHAMVKDCKAQYAEKAASGEDPYQLIEELTECMQQSVNASLESKNEEKDFNAKVRAQLGERLEGYACLDENATETESLENKTWTFERVRYPVQVLLDRPMLQIHKVSTFVSPKECLEIEQAITNTKPVNANGLLANKGSVAFPEEPAENALLSNLEARMYSYAEEVMNLYFEVEEEQEDLFMIHYVGSTDNPHHYNAHCDGECDGGEVQHGDRIATMIFYCNVAKKGGATHFPDLGVHVKPKQGDALFYSYVDKDTGKRDDGLSKHTGCPVLEGEKKILTHKFRLA